MTWIFITHGFYWSLTRMILWAVWIFSTSACITLSTMQSNHFVSVSSIFPENACTFFILTFTRNLRKYNSIHKPKHACRYKHQIWLLNKVTANHMLNQLLDCQMKSPLVKEKSVKIEVERFIIQNSCSYLILLPRDKKNYDEQESHTLYMLSINIARAISVTVSRCKTKLKESLLLTKHLFSN